MLADISAIPGIQKYAGLERLRSIEDTSFRTPLQFMEGIEPPRPIQRIVTSSYDTLSTQNGTQVRQDSIIRRNAHTKLILTPQRYQTKGIKRLKWAIASQNKAANVIEPKLGMCDIVLVRSAVSRGQKRQVKLFRPVKIKMFHI